MYRIGEFSKLSKVTVKTLRYYGSIGLFLPAYIDTETGYRYYSSAQIGELNEVLRYRSMGVSLEDVAQILNGEDALSILNKRKTELEIEIAQKNTQIALVKKYIKELKEKQKMDYQASLKKLPACITYYRKGVIPTMKDLNAFVLEAGEEVSVNNPGLECVDGGYCWVSYTADGYQEKDVELTYFEAVKNYGNESENIKFKEFEECDAICVIHRGAYSKLSDAYSHAIKYVEQKGYKIVAPIREVYIDGCWNKDSEEEYLTEIQIPVSVK